MTLTATSLDQLAHVLHAAGLNEATARFRCLKLGRIAGSGIEAARTLLGVDAMRMLEEHDLKYGDPTGTIAQRLPAQILLREIAMGTSA